MLKNYTSTVPAAKSIAHIEAQLIAHKATQILKIYSPDGKIEALCFIMRLDARDMPFRVPAKVAECEKILRSRFKRPHRGTFKTITDQAERTTWKIISDWLDSELALLELGQREFMEIFLPCLYDPIEKRTYFDVVKERGFKALLPAAAAE